jgi:membrane protease subunit HflK
MALNDPNWGRRGDGPPDLDEIWNRLRHKISGLFGGRGGPRQPGESGGGRFPGGVSLLIILAVVIWLASGFYIVDASQRGVVLRFGKYAHTTEPGPQ